ncbi:MAG TPA: protealysin inhibitor emfourin [Candidatus Thermoplasmatota archaeon]|jgi:hypothetical protein|nr:protealysin inhibitor emfourin [Candidatus Thermoplasmatota archaeon]
MRVRLERTGGFAGLQGSASVDAGELPPADAARLEQLVRDARFFDLPAMLKDAGPARDRFQYRLTVEQGDRTHTISVDEGAAPGPIRALVEFVQASAKAKPR